MAAWRRTASCGKAAAGSSTTFPAPTSSGPPTGRAGSSGGRLAQTRAHCCRSLPSCGGCSCGSTPRTRGAGSSTRSSRCCRRSATSPPARPSSPSTPSRGPWASGCGSRRCWGCRLRGGACRSSTSRIPGCRRGRVAALTVSPSIPSCGRSTSGRGRRATSTSHRRSCRRASGPRSRGDIASCRSPSWMAVQVGARWSLGAGPRRFATPFATAREAQLCFRSS
mmetsp:Transcript_51761/g.145382  ORF Transcript_51761/g.145382 Transcript_51761/m.145382 type:complete len:223 (+) Transcript_51761:860-1528(+)